MTTEHVDLSDLKGRAEEAVATLEELEPEPWTHRGKRLADFPPAPWLGPQNEANASIRALRDAAAEALFPPRIRFEADVLAAFEFHTSGRGQDRGPAIAELHARSLGEWPELATFIRSHTVLQRVVRNDGNEGEKALILGVAETLAGRDECLPESEVLAVDVPELEDRVDRAVAAAKQAAEARFRTVLERYFRDEFGRRVVNLQGARMRGEEVADEIASGDEQVIDDCFTKWRHRPGSGRPARAGGHVVHT